jgi:hypothetical protein
MLARSSRYLNTFAWCYIIKFICIFTISWSTFKIHSLNSQIVIPNFSMLESKIFIIWIYYQIFLIPRDNCVVRKSSLTPPSWKINPWINSKCFKSSFLGIKIIIHIEDGRIFIKWNSSHACISNIICIFAFLIFSLSVCC